MDRVALIDHLVALEATLPVSEWTALGVPLWPMIRLELHATNAGATVTAHSLAGGVGTQLRALGGGLARWGAARARDWRGERSPDAPADVVFLAYTTGRQPLVEGKRMNPLLQPYVELAAREGMRVGVWEMAPYGSYNVPRAAPSAYIQPRMMADRLRTLRSGHGVCGDLPAFDLWRAELDRRGLHSRYAAPVALGRDAVYVRRLADRFGRWLARGGARTVFTADYGFREQALNLAARERGVRTIELQHGVQGPHHAAYARWTRVPAGGWATRADRYWCWDTESAETINAWAGTAGPRPVVGGNAWESRWRREDLPSVARVRAQIAALKARIGGDTHILVSVDSHNDVIPAPLLAAMHAAPAGWRWWLRPHPSDFARRAEAAAEAQRAMGRPFVHPAEVGEMPLPALAAALDVHVTNSWSTVVRDVAGAGLRSVAWEPFAGQVFAKERESGSLRMTAPDGVLAALETQLGAGRTAGTPVPDPRAAMRTLLGGG